MFKIGEKVKWTSQSLSYETTKQGKVFVIIPANVAPPNHIPGYRCVYGYGPGLAIMPRNHESCLVEVSGGKTAKAKTKLYWPRVSQLERLNP